MKKFNPFIFLTFFLFACSGQAWLAKIYIVKAENAFAKAHAMRIKKSDTSYQERLEGYHTACDYFSKAYQIHRDAFTLNRIGEAVESCLRVEDFTNEKIFREFEEEYVQNHPEETKYGEAGAFGNLES